MQLGIVDECLCELVDEGGVDQRLVALDVENVGGSGDLGNCFSEAVGAGWVVGGGHYSLSTEGFDCLEDPLIIGGDEDVRKIFRPFATLPDVLDEGLSGDEMKRLSGEACGAPACRENADNQLGRS